MYVIVYPGTTDFTLIRTAADNNPGTIFTSTGSGIGTGIVRTTAGGNYRCYWLECC